MGQSRALQGIDWPTILLGLLLLIFGVMNVYSVNPDLGVKQMITAGLGALMIFGLIIISNNNRNFFEANSIMIYAISVILLAGVLVIGKEINGAKAWYRFGSFSLQPAEFAKIGTALLIANFLNHSNTNLNDLSTLGRILLILIIPIALIMIQPDLGSVIIFCSLAIPLYREGLNSGYLIIPIIGVVLFLISIVQIPFYVLILFGFIVLFISLLINAFNYSQDVEDMTYGVMLALVLFFGLIIGLSYLVSNLSLETRESFGHLYPERALFFSDPIRFNVNFYGFIGLILSLIPVVLMKIGRKKESMNSPFKINSGFKTDVMTTSAIVAIITLIFVTSLSFISPIIFEKLPKHQKERVMVLYEGEAKYRDTSGYNLLYAKTAIGSGEFAGKGYLQGTVKKGKFVPEQQTDYIFVTVGEEWGFLGSVAVVLVYSLFIGRIYYLAERHTNRFVRFYGYSVASILLFHFFINIAMVMGLFPTVGIPLPFFSYGGSSLWGFTILIGIFLIVHFQHKQSLL